MSFRESSFWPANRALFRRRTSRAGAWIGVGMFALLVVTMTGAQLLH